MGTAASPIEVHGESGTLQVPDPNLFDGEVHLRRLGDQEWSTLPPSAGYERAERGIGLLDYLRDGEGRASGAIALHVLEIMTALLESGREGRRVDLRTTAERPTLVPLTPYEDWSRQ